MCDAIDAGIAASLFEDTEKEIVSVDRSSAAGREDERIGPRVGSRASPEFELSVNGRGKPNERIAALGLRLNLYAVRDATVDPQAVALFVGNSSGGQSCCGSREAAAIRRR